MKLHDTSENPGAVAFIRRRGRVSEPAARTISELAGFRASVPTEQIIERALSRLAALKQGAR